MSLEKSISSNLNEFKQKNTINWCIML